jgi:hypothetical protein
MKRAIAIVVVPMVGLMWLDVQAAAPVGQYAIVADGGVVVDARSALIWERGHSKSRVSWSSAATYCPGLSLGGYSSGWRVPAKSELETLVDVGATNPATDTSAFADTPSTWGTDFFWSSTRFADSSGGEAAWTVEFTFGRSSRVPTSSGSGWVRCVR